MQASLIAIVDDEPLVRSATSSLLRSYGFDCRTFSSGEELLDAQIDGFRCVLSDIQMPGMSGLVLAQLLHERMSGVPVLLMSAYPNEAAEILCRQGRVAAVLDKPLDGELLEAAIQATIPAGNAGDGS